MRSLDLGATIYCNIRLCICNYNVDRVHVRFCLIEKIN